jgi:hypothetical protein
MLPALSNKAVARLTRKSFQAIFAAAKLAPALSPRIVMPVGSMRQPLRRFGVRLNDAEKVTRLRVRPRFQTDSCESLDRACRTPKLRHEPYPPVPRLVNGLYRQPKPTVCRSIFNRMDVAHRPDNHDCLANNTRTADRAASYCLSFRGIYVRRNVLPIGDAFRNWLPRGLCATGVQQLARILQIPTPFSAYSSLILRRSRGASAPRASLKSLFEQSSGGSSPLFRTIRLATLKSTRSLMAGHPYFKIW